MGAAEAVENPVDRLVLALVAGRSPISFAQIASIVCRSTASESLARLVSAGLVERFRRGFYVLSYPASRDNSYPARRATKPASRDNDSENPPPSNPARRASGPASRAPDTARRATPPPKEESLKEREGDMPVVCSKCSRKETKWVGRCSGCGEWNTYAAPEVKRPARKAPERKPIARQSYADFKRTRDSAAPPPRTTAEVLGTDLDQWFRGVLLTRYQCRNPRAVAPILAEVSPNLETRAKIEADVAERFKGVESQFWPWLGNYLREKTWEFPLANTGKPTEADVFPYGDNVARMLADA
jgi:DNA-binding transcriptional ArsR family regulator